MPQYFMSVYMLPKWVLKRVDQIRRRFLWHGHKDHLGQKKGLYMVNWSVATRSREQGGLGIRDIRAMNCALLAKWLWIWHDRQHNWWKDATPMPTLNDKPWNDQRASPFWRNITCVVPAFNSSVCFQLGTGDTINFWHDNWLGTPLKFLYPNLYQLMQQNHISVHQCWANDAWTLQFPDLTLTAQAEKTQLMLNLQSVRPTSSHDKIIWLRDSKGFSVSSMYRFLTHTPSPHTTMASVWKIKAPLRVLIFSWLLLTNRLTTIDNITRRGWNLPNMCSMCKASEETVDHLFQHCIVAKEIRNYIYTVLVDPSISQRYNSTCSTQMLIDPKESTKTKQWEITTCFILWRERCRRVFSNKELPWMSLVREIQMERKQWFQDKMIAAPFDPG